MEPAADFEGVGLLRFNDFEFGQLYEEGEAGAERTLDPSQDVSFQTRGDPWLVREASGLSLISDSDVPEEYNDDQGLVYIVEDDAYYPNDPYANLGQEEYSWPWDSDAFYVEGVGDEVTRPIGHQILTPGRNIPEYYFPAGHRPPQYYPEFPADGMLEGDYGTRDLADPSSYESLTPQKIVGRYIGQPRLPAKRSVDPQYIPPEQREPEPQGYMTDEGFIGFDDVIECAYGPVAGNVLDQIYSDFQQSYGIGAEMPWDAFKPSKMPAMANTQAALKKMGEIPPFKHTMAALKKMPAFKPPKVTVSAMKFLERIKVAKPKLPKVPSIKEVKALDKLIRDYGKKLDSQLRTAKLYAGYVTKKKFKNVPKWKLGRGKKIIKAIVYNFNTANSIFKTVQNAINQGIKFTDTSADFVEGISKQTASLAKNFPNVVGKFTGDFFGNMQTSLNAFTGEISKDAAKFGGQIQKKLQWAINSINKFILSVQSKVQKWIQSIMTAIQRDIEDVAKTISKNINGVINGITKDVNGLGGWMTSNLTGMNKNMELNLDKSSQFMRKDIEKTVKGFQGSVEKNLKTFQGKLRTDLEKNVKSQISGAHKQIQAVTNKNMKTFQNQITGQQKHLTSQFKGMQNQLKVGGKQIKDLNKQITGFQGTMKGFDSRFKTFDKSFGTFDKRFKGFDKSFKGFDERMKFLDSNLLKQNSLIGKQKELLTLNEGKIVKQQNLLEGLTKNMNTQAFTLKKQDELVTAQKIKVQEQGGILADLGGRVKSLEGRGLAAVPAPAAAPAPAPAAAAPAAAPGGWPF